MLIPNLSVLLAERRLTLSRVSQDTRISRTTLTALAACSAKGIQFDTLNTLCQYLKVTPDAIFLYRPFDLDVAAGGVPGPSTVEFTVRRAGRHDEHFTLKCDARLIFADDSPNMLEALRVRLSLPESDDPDRQARDRDFADLLRALPAPILSALELEILRAFDRNIDPALAPDDYSPELEWPWQTASL